MQGGGVCPFSFFVFFFGAVPPIRDRLHTSHTNCASSNVLSGFVRLTLLTPSSREGGGFEVRGSNQPFFLLYKIFRCMQLVCGCTVVATPRVRACNNSGFRGGAFSSPKTDARVSACARPTSESINPEETNEHRFCSGAFLSFLPALFSLRAPVRRVPRWFGRVCSLYICYCSPRLTSVLTVPLGV